MTRKWLRRGLGVTALALIATFADAALPPTHADAASTSVAIICDKFVGTDSANNLWVQWSKCTGLAANDYMQRVRGKFCTWFDNHCYTFSGPFVTDGSTDWSKLNVSAAKFERKGVWTQLCPMAGC